MVLMGAAVALASAAAACGYGTTGSADQVRQTGARLHGDIASTLDPGAAGDAATTFYWFEYGATDAYGARTPTGSVDVPSGESVPVSAVVTGVEGGGSTFHYRVCAQDSLDARGTCGGDRTVTTLAGDYVVGDGSVGQFPVQDPMHPWITVWFPIGGAFDAGSDAGGANPNGTATARPSALYQNPSDTGSVTCLEVLGNRAAVGFTVAAQGGPGVPLHYTAFVEDNGATGDRWSVKATTVSPITTCPSPTAADFQAVNAPGGTVAGPTLVSGGFTVHDQT
jgi:hypothetical protein